MCFCNIKHVSVHIWQFQSSTLIPWQKKKKKVDNVGILFDALSVNSLF